MVGVHFSTVASWERGDREPKLRTKMELAKALNCTIYDLFPDMVVPHDAGPSYVDVPSPFGKFPGHLRLGDKVIDCYVLDTGHRVITLQSAVSAISDKVHGNLGAYLDVKALHGLIDPNRVIEGTVEFYIPTSGVQMTGRGLTAEAFIEVCDAYVMALEQNLLTTKRQREMAVKCSAILRSCAKVGLIALIDEATGYQYERAEDALQLKLRAFIAEELREWEKTFPDELWEEFGRLTGWRQPIHSRPKWWGKLVMELIYDALDADVAKYLRTHKPPPRYGQNYHQWLTENYGLKQLVQHINQVIGVAKTCNDINELRSKVGYIYGKKPLQLTLYM
jgi:hypothetical protein